MDKKNAVFETCFSTLKLHSRGKVRDIYDLGESFLIVATDRISAYDVRMPTPIPNKGKILNQMSLFWRLRIVSERIILTDVISALAPDFPSACFPYAPTLQGRSMWVRKAEVLPVECIVRGYIVGSAWKEYQETGSVCGISLPSRLMEGEKLPQPIFTPSTKGKEGSHDENISFSQMIDIIGRDLAEQAKAASLKIYRMAAQYALSRSIIVADTKFEFGLIDGRLSLIDEVLTPDSSRFWPADGYSPGRVPESFDKQFLRDYLKEIGWNPNKPAPVLPPEVVALTQEKYNEAYFHLLGKHFIS